MSVRHVQARRGPRQRTRRTASVDMHQHMFTQVDEHLQCYGSTCKTRFPTCAGKKAAAAKKAGDMAFASRKGAAYLHPASVNFTETDLDSRYAVYHEVNEKEFVAACFRFCLLTLLGRFFGTSCCFVVSTSTQPRVTCWNSALRCGR